jgi:hypothetical protein
MKLRLALTSLSVFAAIALSQAPAAPLQAAAAPSWTTLDTAAFSNEHIIDIAVSPDYARDKTLFVLTSVYTSVWNFNLRRTQNGAVSWQKMYTTTDVLDYVAVSPAYGQSAQVVYMLGSAGGNAGFWRSQDAGATWAVRPAPEGTDQGPFAVASDMGVFVSGYDGTQAWVYSTSNGGVSFTAGTAVGNNALSSLALSPDYSQDRTLMAGATDGGVYWSRDGGSTFGPVSSTFLPSGQSAFVAFDDNFDTDSTVYAVSDAVGGGVYSTSVGLGRPWQRLDAASPADETLGGVAVSSTGVLYAASFDPVSAANAQGGLLRCLSPVAPALFERINGGLSDGAVLYEGSLVCSGNQLWAIDSADNLLVTFVDSLSQPVTPLAPADDAPAGGNLAGGAVSGVVLTWQLLPGAATYTWQLSPNSSFSVMPNGFSGNTSGTSVPAPALVPAGIYYWRVRAASPLYSPWSAVWSFSTPSPPAAIGTPQLQAPSQGNVNAALEPLFQWSAMTGATGYELVVSRSQDFSNPVISKTGSQSVSSNSWASDVSLAYSTLYYWRVRAVTAAGAGPWSVTGIFVTLDAAAPTVTVITTNPPPAPSQTITVTAPASSQPVVTTAVPTTTAVPPVVPAVPGGIPGWVYYATAGGGAVVLLLAVIALLARGGRKRLL